MFTLTNNFTIEYLVTLTFIYRFEKILSTINIEFSPEILIKATPPFQEG